MAEKAPWETEEEIAPWETPAPQQERMVPSISLEGLGRGALEALPIAGGIAGGIIGAGGGPLGMIGGSSLGAVAGKSLEQAGKEFFFDEGPKTREEQYKALGQEAALGALGEVGGQAFGRVLEKGVELGSKALPKIGHALTGVSETEIKTYAKRAKDIQKLAQETSGSTLEAADQIRRQYQADVGTRIADINKEIGSVLQQSSKTVESAPIYDALESYKSKLNPELYIEDIRQIEDLQGRILNASKGDKIPIKDANDIKQFLQEKARSAYRNGEMFQIGKEAANAAKGGAAEARKLIDAVEPRVTQLNANLQKIHEIEDSMNLNLMKVGAPEAALMAAGSGGNVRSLEALKKLGQETGTPMLEQAENLAAMRTFTNPPFLPVDPTGKSLTRMAVGGALGSLAGPGGTIVGGALASPVTLKSMIDVGRTAAPMIEKAIPQAPTRDMLYKGLIQKYFEAPSGQIKQAEPEKKRPDQSSILQKLQGTPYQQVLQRALEQGGEQSFSAANYVLMNRDQKYRDLMSQEV